MPVTIGDLAMSHRLGMPSFRIAQALAWLSIALSMAMLATGAMILLDARREVWSQAIEATNRLSIAMEQEIARSISAYDLTIQGAIEALRLPDLGQVSSALRRAAVFNKATTDDLGSLTVVDAAGDVVLLDAAPRPPLVRNFSDRAFFAVQRDRPDAGLFFSRALPDRVRGGGPVMVLSRRRDGPDGAFAGAVLGAIKLQYFQDLFAALYFGKSGSVSLFRADGRILARYPPDPSAIDADPSQSTAYKTIANAPFGQFIETAKVDGKPRLYTFRRIGDFPLILNIGISVEEIYAPWWHKTILIGALLTGLAGATVLLGVLFSREMRRRVIAEGGLVKAAQELSTQASTDGLTGLENRRAFDLRLEQAWRRAGRIGGPLALLMVDVDEFKLYNDEYGHPAGDEVLRAVAACIRGSIRGAIDVGARYGGEEFVAILPDTELADAARIAERIRAAVAARALPHRRVRQGHVTVSIGAAMGRPMRGEDAQGLLRQADARLYDAKQAGRDRIAIVAGPGGDSLTSPAVPAARG